MKVKHRKIKYEITELLGILGIPDKLLVEAVIDSDISNRRYFDEVDRIVADTIGRHNLSTVRGDKYYVIRPNVSWEDSAQLLFNFLVKTGQLSGYDTMYLNLSWYLRKCRLDYASFVATHLLSSYKTAREIESKVLSRLS